LAAQRASLDEIYSSSFLNSGYIPNELPLSSLHTEPLILAVVPRQDRSQRVALENAPVASDPNELASSLAAISINDKKTVQETSKAVISSSAEVAPTLTNVSPSSGKGNTLKSTFLFIFFFFPFSLFQRTSSASVSSQQNHQVLNLLSLVYSVLITIKCF